jgi:phage gp45-like
MIRVEVLPLNRNQNKIALSTLNTDDSEEIPQAQASYLGKTADITLVMPYGLTSRAPQGKSLLAMLNQQGNESARLAIPFAPLARKRNLKDGETVLENMLSGAYMYLKENGDLEVVIPRHITQTSKNITVTADDVSLSLQTVTATTKAISLNASSQNITITGVNALSVTATTGNFNIGTLNITGNIVHTGNYTVTGNVATTGTLTNNGKAVGSTHTHGGVTTGAGNTAVPN